MKKNTRNLNICPESENMMENASQKIAVDSGRLKDGKFTSFCAGQKGGEVNHNKIVIFSQSFVNSNLVGLWWHGSCQMKEKDGTLFWGRNGDQRVQI